MTRLARNPDRPDGRPVSPDGVYLCLPLGPTEKNIAISLSPAPGSGVPVREYFSSYRIRGFGKGLESLLRGIRATAEPKFGLKLPEDFEERFGRLLAAQCRCRLRDRETGQTYSEHKLSGVFDVLRRDPPSRGRARQIARYARKKSERWDPPVFISAGVLGVLGADAQPGTCLILDGARRIAAFALRGRSEISAGLVMTPGEYDELGAP